MFSFQAPELCSTATSPIKNYQEEQTQTLTPPGKGPIASVRSPNCGRQQASVRGARLNPSNSGASGMKNRVIRLIAILPQNTGISLSPTVLFRWTQPPTLSLGAKYQQWLRGRRICSSHHIASQQLSTQQNVFPQQGSWAVQTAARLH